MELIRRVGHGGNRISELFTSKVRGNEANIVDDAYHGAQHGGERFPQLNRAPDEDRVRLAGHFAKGVGAEIVDRADHIVELHENSAPDDTEDEGAPESTNESLNSLLWGQFDEWSTSKELAPDVGEAIVADDQRCRNPEPDQAFEDVIHNEVTAETDKTMSIAVHDLPTNDSAPREDDDQKTHMHPAEQAKLLLQVPFLQRHHEAHKANDVEDETDHSMIRSEGQELRIGENNMLCRI